jgi:hypothetical protein
MKKFLFPATLTIIMIVFCLSSCNRMMDAELTTVEPEFGYYIKTAEFPSFFKTQKASIFFIEKWGTPEYFYLGEEETPVLSGITHDQGIFLGCLKEDRVYFISEVVTDFGDTIAVEKFLYSYAVTKDPRITSAWLANVICLIEDDSMAEEDLNLEEFIERATFSEDEKEEEFSSYRHELKEKILAEEGKTVKEKLVNFTSQLIPGSPRNWEKRQWFYAEWNYLELEPSY